MGHEFYVSIDTIRATALELKTKGVEPNSAQIAKRLGQTRQHVYYLVTKKYIGHGLDSVVVLNEQYTRKKVGNFVLLRNATRELRSCGRIPCLDNLSAQVGWSRKALREYLVRYPLLAKELDLDTDLASCVWDAARVILSRGETLTRLSLSQETGYRYRTIGEVLSQHPRWVEALGVVRAPNNSGVCMQLGVRRKKQKNRHE